MKILFLIGVSLLCFDMLQVFETSSMSKKPGLELNGQIENHEITDEGDRVKLSFRLDLSFTNTGDTPILLLSEKPTLIGRKIGNSSEKNEEKMFFIWTRPSIRKNDKLREGVDKASLPEKYIKRIEVGETVKTEITDWFYISKDDKSWDQLIKADRLSLQLICETWPLNIEPRGSTLDDKKLGQELRKRWDSFGYLWTDEIISEPIMLDVSLASTIAKK